MKKYVRKFTNFSRTIGNGLYVELKETIDIPKHIKNKDYKKAAIQVGDIFKMAGLTIIWVVPGGAVITAMILKFSHKARPSAFHPIEEKSKDLISQLNGDFHKKL